MIHYTHRAISHLDEHGAGAVALRVGTLSRPSGRPGGLVDGGEERRSGLAGVRSPENLSTDLPLE